RYGPFLTCGNRLLLSSSSALTYSFSSTKIVALVSRFVRFKRFHFAKPFFFVSTFLFGIKKRDLTVSTCLATFYSSGT
ncbi:hypothetical protein VBC33_13495, partial [Staphylococcus argenteus]|uniref:hypothetical protein n=1 Tax=Staphylococcus argenteus TaxID=985002 RepID=UPI002B236BE4